MTATIAPIDLSRVIQDHLGLIWREARYWHSKNRDVDVDDLFQEVAAGWLDAARRFDPSFGVKLATYASHYGRQRARLCVWSTRSRGIRIPDKKKDRFAFPKVSQIVPVDKESPSNLDTDSVAPAPQTPEYRPEEFWPRVRRMVSPRTYEVLCLRYALGVTQARCARLLRVKRQRIQQVEMRAMEVLADSEEFAAMYYQK